MKTHMLMPRRGPGARALVAALALLLAMALAGSPILSQETSVEQGGPFGPAGPQPNTFYAAGSGLWSRDVASDGETVLVGDFDGGGRDDLVVLRVNGAVTTPVVHRSSGARFEDPVSWQGGELRSSAHVLKFMAGDFNGDGRDDLAAFTRTGDSVSVSVTLSDGADFGRQTAEPWTVWLTSPLLSRGIICLGDVNRDGRDDIVCFAMDERDGDEAGDVYVATASFDEASRTGAFSAPSRWHEDFGHGAMKPFVGDVNGDDRADIILCACSASDPARGIDSGAVLVALADGNRFVSQPQPWHREFAAHGEYLEAGDVSGDRLTDLVAFTRGDPATRRAGDPEGNVITSLGDGSSFGPAVMRHDNFCLRGDLPILGDFDGSRYQGINVPRPAHDDIAAVSGNRGRPEDRGAVRVAVSTFGRSTTWRLRYEQLRVRVKTSEITNDDPYLVTLRFQSRFGFTGSSETTYRGYTDDWSGGMVQGDVKDLPEAMGTAYFTGVTLLTRSDLRHIRPQIMGVVTAAMEGDFTPPGRIYVMMERMMEALRETLNTEVERREYRDFRPENVLRHLAAMKNTFRLLTMAPMEDNDEFIGYRLFMLLAVDPECRDLVAGWQVPDGVEQGEAIMGTLWPMEFVFDQNALLFKYDPSPEGEYEVSGYLRADR